MFCRAIKNALTIISVELRSLTAFGNYNGRESVMSNGTSYSSNRNYNALYQNTELPGGGGFGGGPPDPDRPNPFVAGGEVSQEASSVVQNFLRVRTHALFLRIG